MAACALIVTDDSGKALNSMSSWVKLNVYNKNGLPLGAVRLTVNSSSDVYIQCIREEGHNVTLRGIAYRCSMNLEYKEGRWQHRRGSVDIRRESSWDGKVSESARSLMIECVEKCVGTWVSMNANAMQEADREVLVENVERIQEKIKKLQHEISDQEIEMHKAQALTFTLDTATVPHDTCRFGYPNRY